VYDSLSPLVTEGLHFVERSMDRFRTELRELCLLESPSGYKPGLDAVANYLATLLQRVGAHTTLVEHPEGGNALVATFQGDNPAAPPVLLLCHHDTVHPVGVAEQRTRVEGTKFYGPGTIDMKGCILLAIYALEALMQKDRGYKDFQDSRNFKDFNKITLLSVPDEEATIRYHVDLMAQLCEERPLVLVMEGAHSIGNVVTDRKGGARYVLTAEGVAAHAGSAPEAGKNAVLELAHQIVQFCSLHRWREGVTINAGPVRGGSVPNIVSDFAEVIFDIRYPLLEDRMQMEARWREMMQRQLVPGVQLTLSLEPNGMPPMVATDKSLTMVEHVQWIAEHVLHEKFEPEVRGGCSDGCHTALMGCPTIDGLGAIGGKAHHADEHLWLDKIPPRAALLAGLIAAITTTPAEL
jgi:glutamate carboxypeptidase